MTTAARQAEADRVELVYYWALNQLGNAMVVDALQLWNREVPLDNYSASQTSPRWLTEAFALLSDFREVAIALALAYYRLIRALRTGATIRDGDEQAGELASLEALRDAFESIVDEIEQETSDDATPNFDVEEEGVLNFPEPPLELGDDEDAIEIEDLGDIQALLADMADAALEEAGLNLDALGTQYMLDQIDDGVDPAVAFDNAANQQALAALRIMLNAARGLVYDLAETDLRVIGWARFSKTGKPCGWCAMLISRGVIYKTRTSALAREDENGQRTRVDADGQQDDPDKYHIRCKCVAVPVFIQSQFDESPMFDQNRLYADLWKTQIRQKNLGGDAALTAWRRLIRQRNLTQPALAAA